MKCTIQKFNRFTKFFLYILKIFFLRLLQLHSYSIYKILQILIIKPIHYLPLLLLDFFPKPLKIVVQELCVIEIS